MKNCTGKNKRAETCLGSMDPETRVRQGNQWYVGEQFSEQLGKPGTRSLIQRRWKYFGEIFLDYLSRRAAGASAEGIGPLRYLDAGCGDGINLQWAAGFFEGHNLDVRLTALDYNALRVGRVRDKQLAEEVHVASLLEMPFRDATFDLILCNHVLEHIGPYPRALAEIRRVLKPGGLLVLGVPNEGCVLAHLRNRVIQRSILKSTDHVNFFTSKTLDAPLRAAGFEVVRVCHEGFFLPHFWAHYALTYVAWGGRLLSMLGRIFPSQSAGLITYAIKR
jgi:SAM-dependent methyltransferase